MIVYTDGSRIPGQDNRGYAGAGIWFGHSDVRNTSVAIESVGTTNQYAELLAIFRTLVYCRDMKELTIRSDSQYSINCITSWSPKWISNGWKNSKGETVVNSDIIKNILDIMSYRKSCQYSTSFEHVYGHKNDIGNISADKLAVAGSNRIERTQMSNIVYFYSHTHGEYACFSQFYPSAFSLDYDGKTVSYVCAEQHHHHRKAVLFNDNVTAARIMATSNPSEHIKLGRMVKSFDNSIWLRNRIQICTACTIAKFEQNQDLMRILLSTKGKRIAESSPTDRIWGIGISAAQSKARVKWTGTNLLGEVLMQVRDEMLRQSRTHEF